MKKFLRFFILSILPVFLAFGLGFFLRGFLLPGIKTEESSLPTALKKSYDPQKFNLPVEYIPFLLNPALLEPGGLKERIFLVDESETTKVIATEKPYQCEPVAD